MSDHSSTKPVGTQQLISGNPISDDQARSLVANRLTFITCKDDGVSIAIIAVEIDQQSAASEFTETDTLADYARKLGGSI